MLDSASEADIGHPSTPLAENGSRLVDGTWMSESCGNGTVGRSAGRVGRHRSATGGNSLAEFAREKVAKAAADHRGKELRILWAQSLGCLDHGDRVADLPGEDTQPPDIDEGA